MTAIALVQKVKNLPTVSEAALKLLSLLEQSTVDNEDIVQVLKYDNVLTAKLLRACNSPSLGLEESVSSVDQAVLILGHQQILRVVMTLAFGGITRISSMAYIMEVNELWEHSLVSATAVEIVIADLAQSDANASVAFTASLLHDIGKLVIGQTVSEADLAEIRDRCERKQISGSQAEQEVLGVDHGEVGAALLRNWRLPPGIVEAVENHHRPAMKPEPRLSALVHIANAVAHHAKPPSVQNPHDLRVAEEVATEWAINDEKLDHMVGAARQYFEHVERFMAMG